VRICWGLLPLATALAFQAAKPPQAAIVEDRTHPSQVFGEVRAYRIFLPPAYRTSAKRYPVIYWFHGFGEGATQSDNGRNYDEGGYGGDTIASFVATHDAIVVKWDGYNPRTPGEKYTRPYNVGPVETSRQFPFYFPELVDYIDKTYRTIADRDHRAVTGYSNGGFMAFWIAGKYPDLVSSASSFMGSPEFFVGPQGFDVEYSLEDLYGNYDGVRTRLVTGSRDFIQFYHRRLNAVWSHAAPHHETENFDSDHATPGIAKTLEFHLRSFANPLPRPAVFNHADVYPNFAVWGWAVASNRRQPGFTILQNVSGSGFRSAVREWVPGGGTLPNVKMSIDSPPIYPAGRPQTVTYIRLRDGNVRRSVQKADPQGRLTFELDGDAYEVGVSAAPLLTVSGYEIADAAWATGGQPVKLRVRFWNKGGARSATSLIQWKSPDADVKFEPASSRLFALGPGESAALPVQFTVTDPARTLVRIVAMDGASSLPVDVPLFPPAEPAKDFEIADGRTLNVFQHAVEASETRLGEGNGDGHAAPGETFALLLPDAPGGPLRAAELFTNDACVENFIRISDSWVDYDHVGASAKYSLPTIRPECEPGHVIAMLARVLIPNTPNHQVRYWQVQLPVWYRQQGNNR
jgi:enterochelin esterase-like enzyme